MSIGISEKESARPPRLMFVAGEASGDAHASAVIREILGQSPSTFVFGLGGHQMRDAGMRLDVDLVSELRALMGFVRVVFSARAIFRMLDTAEELLRRERPDALVLVDYPGFNLRLARRAARLGIPVIYYISPQIWGWNYRRINAIRRDISLMLVIFPFERDMYEREHVPVDFVGHPLVDEGTPQPLVGAERDAMRAELLSSLPTVKTAQPLLIGLVPGSRRGELERHMPPLLEAARLIANRLPQARFVLPRARTITPEYIDHFMAAARDLPIAVTDLNSRQVYSVLDFAICKSGTSTLEMALSQTPFIVIYRMSFLNEIIVRILIKIKWVGLPNIIMNRTVAPELLGIRACTGANIAAAALRILEDPKRLDAARADLRELTTIMGGSGAAKRAAMSILQYVREHH